MADKKPIRAVFNDSNVATGLAEFQTGDTVPLIHGGLGAALSIGSAGQVLKVNSGASALEFGAVEAIINIDTATNLTSATLEASDQIMVSDGGTEGRATLSQIQAAIKDTTATLTNKTIAFGSNTVSGTLAQFQTAVTDATLVDLDDSQTLTNKAINASNNTISNIVNSNLSGSAGITNANLANSTVTVGSTSINLGASATTIAGVSDLTVGTINIAGNEIKSSDSTVVEIGGGDGLSVAGNLTVAGNMTVTGSTTTVSSTNTTLADQFIELGTGRTGDASGDAGIVIERGDDANAIIGFDENVDEFIVGTGTFTGSSTGNLTFTHGTLSSAGNKIYKSGTAHAVSLVASSSLAGNVTLTLPINDGDANQLLSTDGSGNLAFISATAASGAGLSDLSDDTTPSLGGNLDMNGADIITLSNGNIDLLPHGTGKVIMDGNGTSGGVSVSDGLIDIRTGTGAVSKVKFYCESSNAHAQTIQASPHALGSSSVSVLPTVSGTLVGSGDTDTVTNTMIANSTISISDDSSTTVSFPLGGGFTLLGGSGITTTLSGTEMTIATDGGVVTETSTDTLTNKTISGSNNTLSNIANSSLSNSTVNFGGVTLALGASDTTPAFDLSDATAYPTSSLTGTITNDQLAGSIAASKLAGSIGNDKLSNSSFTISTDDSSTVSVPLGGGLSVLGGTNISSVISGSEITLNLGTGIDAAKLSGGNVSNTEFDFLNGVSSAIQTQLDTKAATSFAIAQAIALG